MLFAYRQQCQRLLHDAGDARFNPADLDSYINTARGQLAGETECIRVYASLALAANTQQYPFSSITFPAGTTGVQGVLNVRMASYALGTGAVNVRPRPWEWFNLYYLCHPVPQAKAPEVFAQFGQGANGTLWFNLPDLPYTVNLDTVCFPVTLTTDTTPEAIPYLWSDAVPYFAAYLAMLNAQKVDAADAMLKLYSVFVDRARKAATPTVMPRIYQGTEDPFLANRLGIRVAAGGGSA